MNWKRFVKHYSLALVVGLAIIAGAGCRFPWPPEKENAVSQPSPSVLKLYRQAVAAYEAEEYAMAEKRFTDLRRRTMDKQLARMALYGMACTALMRAETPRDYQRALALWETWTQLAGPDYQRESPMLMKPLIRDKMLFSNIPLTTNGNDEIESAPEGSRWMLINAANELGRVKKKLAATEQMAQRRKKRIATLEKQIAELKRQIKALETIDQKIQKKKSAIPSAETPPQP